MNEPVRQEGDAPPGDARCGPLPARDAVLSLDIWTEASAPRPAGRGIVQSALRARAEKGPMEGPARGCEAIRGVYAHVPFCFHKCHYCDFYSLVDRDDRQPAYVARLGREIEAAQPLFQQPIETIFIGGGTPTLLRPDLLARTLHLLREGIPRAADCEWTVEANPETVTPEIAATLQAGGVNRVSVGVQSFDPVHLKTLERWHDPASVPRAVGHLRAAGMERINLDLIFGIPGSTLASWQNDLERALELGPDHLSCYGLTYEPNTAMTRRLELGQFEACDDSLEASMYAWTMERLHRAGFEHYEISNFARPGERCRHNMLYWTNADWWALGPSASGHVQGMRFKNLPRLGDWLASDGASPVVDVERVAEGIRAGEELMLGLRLIEGLPLAEVDRLCAVDHATRGAERKASIARHLASGLLERAEGFLRFSRRGIFLADEVLADLV